MPFKDPEAKRAWRRLDNKKNAEKIKACAKDWGKQNPDKIASYKASSAERRSLQRLMYSVFRVNIEKATAKKVVTENKDHRHRRTLRDNVIDFLGGECEWCGFDERVCLEVDHVEPLRRRTNGDYRSYDAASFWRAILKGEETNAQLLCANCHTMKTRLDREYGNGEVEEAFDPYAGLSFEATETAPTNHFEKSILRP